MPDNLPQSDNFTDSAGTTLAEHDVLWVNDTSNPERIIITDANMARGTDDSTTTAYIRGTPAGTEYTVRCDIFVKTNDGLQDSGVLARYTDLSNYYRADASLFQDAWRFIKVSGGSFSIVASSSFSFAADTLYELEFLCGDAEKVIKVDGVELISSSDNGVSAAGKAGLFCSFTSGNSNTTGIWFDNWAAVDGVGGAIRYRAIIG